MKHLTTVELEAGLEEIRQSPRDTGLLKLIVSRPQVETRAVLNEAQLDLSKGLVGDNWSSRPSSRTVDNSPHPEMQLNCMNSRVIALLAQDQERWSLAGDQLYLDLDLSVDNLPAGTRVAIGAAVIEVTAPPHTGCHKFVSRFGLEAMKFVNSPLGQQLRLRGLNARVVTPGIIRVGDAATKVID
jgi:hypothetical protein